MKFRIYDAKKVVPKKSGEYLAIFEHSATNMSYNAAQQGWNVSDCKRAHEMFPDFWVDCPMTAKELRKVVNHG